MILTLFFPKIQVGYALDITLIWLQNHNYNNPHNNQAYDYLSHDTEKEIE